MKSLVLKSMALAAIGSVGVAAMASAALPSISPDSGHAHHRGAGRAHDPFLRVVHRLNLSDEQQRSIHALLESARQQHSSQKQAGRADLSTLANPGDPGYPAAVQKAKTDALNRIQQRSDLDAQIYALLTAEQKAKLPQVLADMQTKMQQRHRDRENRKASGTNS